jgi:hypothetical protein
MPQTTRRQTAKPPQGARPQPVTSHRGTRRQNAHVKVDNVKTPSALTDRDVYAFVLKPGPYTGKNTFIRLNDPRAIQDNHGHRRLKIQNYRYETESTAIAEDLTKQITLGKLRSIKREVLVWLNCPVPGCNAKFKSSDGEALANHFMTEHVHVSQVAPVNDDYDADEVEDGDEEEDDDGGPDKA